MNKNEFYKNLMLTYTVDTEKVKRIAKRRVVKNSSRVLRIIPGAAACAAVTAAAVTLVSLGTAGQGDGIDIVSDADAVARMEAAERVYIDLPTDNTELVDMYVSFESSLSYNEILLSFSKIDEDGDISIRLLYTEKGKYFENSESTAADGTLTFLGAKITAPTSMCKDIRGLKKVSLVELPESGITDDSFSPFGSSELVVTTTTTGTVGNSIEVSIPSYTTTDTEPVTSPADTDTTTPADTNTDTDTETDVTTPEESTTAEPDTDTSPDTEYEDIEIPVAGVTTASIISADRIVVTTADSIRLYRLQENGLSLETTFYASNAKVSWRSYDGTSLFITGCENSGRTRLYWADGKTGVLTELDISAIVADGAEISSVICTPDAGTMVLKTVSEDKTRIYVGRLESTLSLWIIGEYDYPVTSLALIGDKLYLALNDTASSTVFIVSSNLTDGTVTELASYSGTMRCTRSATFNAAALTFTSAEGEETCVLLTPDAVFETELRNISFSLINGRIFTDGERYYYLTGSDTTVIYPEDAEAAFLPASTPGDYTCVLQEDGTAYLMVKE